MVMASTFSLPARRRQALAMNASRSGSAPRSVISETACFPLGGSGAPYQSQNEQQHHGSDDGHDETADVPVETGSAPGEQAKQKAPQKRADDAHNDVLQPALL